MRQAIESGRVQDEHAAVYEALALCEDHELARAELTGSLDEAEALLARGEGIMLTQESMRQLGEDVKQRGRGRLAERQAAPRGWRISLPSALKLI